jgi:hypothetical protein
MGLSDIFRPGWQSPKPQTRIKAVNKLTDQNILLNLTEHDQDPLVRAAAVQRLKDDSKISQAGLSDPDAAVRHAAVTSISNQENLFLFAEKTKEENLRLTALKRINDLDFYHIVKRFPFEQWSHEKETMSFINELLADYTYMPTLVGLLEKKAAELPEDLLQKVIEKINDEEIITELVLYLFKKDDRCQQIGFKIINQINDPMEIAEVATLCDDKVKKQLAEIFTSKVLAEGNAANLKSYLLHDNVPIIFQEKLVTSLEDVKVLRDIAYDRGLMSELREAALKKLPEKEGVFDFLLSASFVRRAKKWLSEIDNKEMLTELALNAVYEMVRAHALIKLDDQDIYRQALLTETDPLVRKSIIRRVRDPHFLIEIATNAEDPDVRSRAVSDLEDQEIIRNAFMNDPSPHVRLASLKKLEDDQELFASIVVSAQEPVLRRLAAKRLKNQEVLRKIAVEESDFDVRKEAIRGLDDQSMDILTGLAVKDPHPDFKELAVRRLKDFIFRDRDIDDLLEYNRSFERGTEGMEFFECDVPESDGLCSDNACPCPQVVIPRGTGYLFIEQSLVDFRRQNPTQESAERAIREWHEQMSSIDGGVVKGIYRLGPILVCEQGAKLRKLNLKIAALDAKLWWKTGLVPFRATPMAGKKSSSLFYEEGRP